MVALIVCSIIFVWVVGVPFALQVERGLIVKGDMFTTRDGKDLGLFFGSILWPLGLPMFLAAAHGVKVKDKIIKSRFK